MLDELTGGRREAYEEMAKFYTEHHGVYSFDDLIDMAAIDSGGQRDAEGAICGLFDIAFRFYANRAQQHGLFETDKLSDSEKRLFGENVPLESSETLLLRMNRKSRGHPPNAAKYKQKKNSQK